MFPLLSPYRHLALRAQRANVQSVPVNGLIVEFANHLVDADLGGARRQIEATVAFLESALGEEQWRKETNPDIPETRVQENPYTYTETDWDRAGRPTHSAAHPLPAVRLGQQLRTTSDGAHT